MNKIEPIELIAQKKCGKWPPGSLFKEVPMRARALVALGRAVYADKSLVADVPGADYQTRTLSGGPNGNSHKPFGGPQNMPKKRRGRPKKAIFSE